MLSLDIPRQFLNDEEDFDGLADEDSRSNTTFMELKHHCLELLGLLQSKSTVDTSSVVASFFQFLKSCSSSSLQPFFDYTLLPLLYILDVAVKAVPPNNSEKNDEQLTKLSDRMVEGVLLCLEELILKCRVNSTDQMIMLMKKLAKWAMLSTTETSEEYREGVIKCFKAMLINLYPCGEDSCSCNIPGIPALMQTDELQSPASNCVPENGECLISFLHLESASPAVGHWLSLLLQAADSEAKKGHRGSFRIRKEALLTFRVLVAKIGIPDALAFFLPGVVSQLGKVLHISNKRISGASGNVDANSHAIRGLAEYLMIVLEDDAYPFINEINSEIGSGISDANSALDVLRHLQVVSKCDQTACTDFEEDVTDVDFGKEVRRLHIVRSKKWLHKTTDNVNILLNATFPQLCWHPSKKVRRAFFAAIKGLLLNCNRTLKDIKPMLLECLCALKFDDSPEISTLVNNVLGPYFSSDSMHCSSTDVAVTFNRLIEKLPKVALGNEDSLAISVAQQLYTVVYFAGPSFMLDNFQSPVMTARFFDVFSLCLSQHSLYSGSLDKHLTSRSSSISYIPSIKELKDFSNSQIDQQVFVDNNIRKPANCPQNIMDNSYDELPRLPPWLAHTASKKMYESLAGILRLAGFALTTVFAKERNLSLVIDIPLNCMRKLVSELRAKQFSSENWSLWYKRTGNGELMRQTSTAICMINEIIFGTSAKAVCAILKTFSGSENSDQSRSVESLKNSWSVLYENSPKTSLVDCIGGILHEYLSHEIWNLPQQGAVDDESKEIALHFSRDVAMIQQVIIEGIGVFGLVLGKDFSSYGFLHSSLYLLLEVLTFSNSHVTRASDAVLRVIYSTCGFSSVGELVVANADYVIDSICRQLRHLEMNSRSPNVLASMLSYIGVAQNILPLLAEPMRYASLELEILGRHHHPQLTHSFLKAVDEISKAAKRESLALPEVAQSYLSDVKSNALASSSEESEWEPFVLKLNDSRRYRRIVASITTSSLSSATPIVTSSNPNECLTALNIIHDGLATLANVEEAFRLERQTFDALEELVHSRAFHRLHDVITTAEDSPDENLLLPAMNKIWPFLISCIRSQKHIVMVVRKCLQVLPKVIAICGGDFFTRRFFSDGASFWKLLSSSPFRRKPFSEKTPLLLPFRAFESDETMAESSNIKVQVAVLDMISALSRDSRSCSALVSVFKKVCGLVVGLVCSGIPGLRDASVNALLGLSTMDPDLTWLLVADVYYSMDKNEFPSPPSPDFPKGHCILPPASSSKEYLFVQYGGQTFGFDIDFTVVEAVFYRLSSLSN